MKVHDKIRLLRKEKDWTQEEMAGDLPPQQAKKIKDFILANQTELMEKWNEFSN